MTTLDEMGVPRRFEQDPAPTTEGRIRKPKLERTKPIRNVAAYARSDDSPPSDDSSEGMEHGEALKSPQDVIDHGIRIAYQVIEDQLDAGQRIVRQLRKAPPRKKDGSPRPSANRNASLTERSLVLYRQVGELSLEILETLTRSPAALSMIKRALGGEADTRQTAPVADANVAPGANREPRCAVQITSKTPVQIELRFFPGARLENALVRPLYPQDPRNPAITTVALLPDPFPAVRVSIPDGQPPDVYSGVITTPDTNEPLGTVVAYVLAK